MNEFDKNKGDFESLVGKIQKSQAAFGFLLVQDSEKVGKSQTLPDLFLLHDYQMIAKSQALPDFSSLLLCTEYGQEMVKYVTPNIDPNVFVAQYKLQLPSKEKIKEFLMKENRG